MDNECLDILNSTLRKMQLMIKGKKAVERRYNGGPRHVMWAMRHYDGLIMKELVLLNVGMKSCMWNNCRMCGLSTKAEELTENQVISELDLLSKLPHLKDVETKALYISPYSFFSDREMSEACREKVYNDIIDANQNIEHIVFMTRPEYISVDKMKNLRRILKRQKIRIWMGLETADPFISKYCIDKGYTIKDVEKVSVILKEFDVGTGIWVMLKPPFLSEREGIEDALKTIKIGLENDYYIRIMPTEVMEYTITDVLYKIGAYRPPYLWSVIEVLKKLTPEQRIRVDVSGPHFEQEWDIVPREMHSSHIYEFPGNCKKCNKNALDAIFNFNTTKDIKAIDNISCECKDRWYKNINEDMASLNYRLHFQYLNVIEQITSGRYLQQLESK